MRVRNSPWPRGNRIARSPSAITEQLFASAAHVAGEQSIPHLAHLGGEALATLNRPAEAETALQAAQAGAATQDLRPLLWRLAIDLGNLYRAERRDEEAEYAFATAQELIEDLAAPITDTALRAHFLQQATALLPHQEPLSPRRAAKRAFGGLTEREREVALDRTGKSESGDRRDPGRQLADDRETHRKHPVQIRLYLANTNRGVGHRKRARGKRAEPALKHLPDAYVSLFPKATYLSRSSSQKSSYRVLDSLR